MVKMGLTPRTPVQYGAAVMQKCITHHCWRVGWNGPTKMENIGAGSARITSGVGRCVCGELQRAGKTTRVAGAPGRSPGESRTRSHPERLREPEGPGHAAGSAGPANGSAGTLAAMIFGLHALVVEPVSVALIAADFASVRVSTSAPENSGRGLEAALGSPSGSSSGRTTPRSTSGSPLRPMVTMAPARRGSRADGRTTAGLGGKRQGGSVDPWPGASLCVAPSSRPGTGQSSGRNLRNR